MTHIKPFTGAATALATPFLNGKIDYQAWERALEYQITQGIDALVVAGTTGEGASLSEKEKLSLIRETCRQVGGRVPVIAGSGSCNLTQACRQSLAAARAGVDALLVVTPYYNKGNGEAVAVFFETVSRVAGLPLLLYNVPSRTGYDMPVDISMRLAQDANICGIKEAGGSLEKFEEYLERRPAGFGVYTGCDSRILPSLALGGDGVISVVSNLYPRRVAALCRRMRQGDLAGARVIAADLRCLIGLLFAEVNPAPLKYALQYLGRDSGELRLPLGEIALPLRRSLETELDRLQNGIQN